ncbi:MAG: hypothetical protein U1D30_06180 [Planctomycetota bacterium]
MSTKIFTRDGIDKFAAGVKGAVVGDTRELKVTLSNSLQDEKLRGKEVDGVFVIREVKELILPGWMKISLLADRMQRHGEVRDVDAAFEPAESLEA